jgi:hypothetical protein
MNRLPCMGHFRIAYFPGPVGALLESETLTTSPDLDCKTRYRNEAQGDVVSMDERQVS